MRRVLTSVLATAALGLATPALAGATKPPNPPTEHGFCSIGNVCSDNGTNTPTTVNPPVFGFAASGGSATGTLLIDILIPNNIAAPGSFTMSPFSSTPASGTQLTGTASLVSTTAWTSGFLDTYLGLPASPNNPIGAFSTGLSLQSGATGFWVYQANLGTNTLLGTSGVGGLNQDNYLMLLGQGVPVGSYIVGFLAQTNSAGTGYGATANSGAILITRPPVPEPATWAMMLLGFGGIGMAMRRSRRRNAALMQIA